MIAETGDKGKMRRALSDLNRSTGSLELRLKTGTLGEARPYSFYRGVPNMTAPNQFN